MFLTKIIITYNYYLYIFFSVVSLEPNCLSWGGWMHSAIIHQRVWSENARFCAARCRQAGMGRLCIRKRFVHPTTVCSSSEWGWCYIIKLGGRYLCHIVGSTHKSIQVSQWILRRRRPPRRSCALCTRLVHRVEELAHTHRQYRQSQLFMGRRGSY